MLAHTRRLQHACVQLGGVRAHCCARRSDTAAKLASSSNMASCEDVHEHNYVWGERIERDTSLPHSKSPALEFQVKALDGHARSAQMQLFHGGPCETPMFMPVGTQGLFSFLVML